ncbi:MAG TPA: hypothetical protein VL461_15695 [Dictyobacter sp.]|jgi:hypothetical protein|nr:hypothetical protein [Dictyobacter sp.]
MTNTLSRTEIAFPQGMHLVGSIPLKDTEEVLRLVSSIVGDRVRRIPDGETGDRYYWIQWQLTFMQVAPELELLPADPTEYASRPRLGVRASHVGQKPYFPNLGYADAAKESYQIFAQLKQSGVIPADCRFQVSLPTPLATVTSFIRFEDQPLVDIAYTEAMERECERLFATIPHHDLAVQWDIAMEFAMLEGAYPANDMYKNKAEIFKRLVALGNLIPEDVELGYHLCYGDAEHKHFVEPEDTALLTEVANAISEGVKRPVNWLHMPVPRGRKDDAYFAPLQQLRLQPSTEFYLGLVHLTDGVEGTQQRVAAAQRVVPNFGVATECGMGRRTADTIPALLHVHREVTRPVR